MATTFSRGRLFSAGQLLGAAGKPIAWALVLFTLATAACGEGDSDSSLANASNGGFDIIRDETGRVLAVRGRFAVGDGPPEARSRDFLERYAGELGLPEGLEIGAAEVLADEVTSTVVFELRATGVPIERGEVRLRQTADTIFYLSLNVPIALPSSTTPTVTASAAAAAVADAEPTMTTQGDPTLVVFAPPLFFGGTAQPRLAWRVGAVDTAGPSAPDIYVDALDGTILQRLERRQKETNRSVWDMQGNWSDSENVLVYTEEGPVAGVTPPAEATLAYQYAARGCDYLWDRFGVDAPCKNLEIYVQYGDADEAYQHGGTLEFGPGALADEQEGERTLLHELGHAYHLHSVPGEGSPVGTGEPGAVSEAIADIFSMLVTQPATWMVDPGGQFERNLENPALGNPLNPQGNPATYADRRPLEDKYDGGHVHENSLILSHAIWRATIEGVTVGDQHAAGIGYSEMEQILNEMLRGYSGPSTDLRQAASHLIDACMIFPLWREVAGVPAHSITFRACGVLINALASTGLSEPDNDLDGVPNSADICKDRYDPWQEDSDRNNVGDACEPDAPPTDDRLPYPPTPDAYPQCPASIPTGLADDPTWQLISTSDVWVRTAASGTTLAEEHYYEIFCWYGSSVTEYKQSYAISWQPRDSTVYQTEHWWFCDPSLPLDEDGTLMSATHRVRADVGNAGNVCCSGIAVAQHYANLSPMAAAGEEVALPCP